MKLVMRSVSFEVRPVSMLGSDGILSCGGVSGRLDLDWLKYKPLTLTWE